MRTSLKRLSIQLGTECYSDANRLSALLTPTPITSYINISQKRVRKSLVSHFGRIIRTLLLIVQQCEPDRLSTPVVAKVTPPVWRPNFPLQNPALGWIDSLHSCRFSNSLFSRGVRKHIRRVNLLILRWI